MPNQTEQQGTAGSGIRVRTPEEIRKRLGSQAPPIEKSTEDPSGLQKALAAATRVGTGWLGSIPAVVPNPVGTTIGFGVGAGGEYLAQAIEEGFIPRTPSELREFIKDPVRAGRATVEGGLTALPGGVFVKGGKAIQSLLRSGAISAGAEAIRELVRGEDLSVPSLLLSGAAGGGTGALLGKLTGLPKVAGDVAASAPKRPASMPDLLTQSGEDAAAFQKELPNIMLKEGWMFDIPTVLQKANELTEDFGKAVREAAMRNTTLDPHAIQREVNILLVDNNFDDAFALAEAAVRTKKVNASVLDNVIKKRDAKLLGELAGLEAQEGLGIAIGRAEAAMAGKEKSAAIAKWLTAAKTKLKVEETAARSAKTAETKLEGLAEGKTTATKKATVIDPVTGETKTVTVKLGEEDKGLIDALLGGGRPVGPPPRQPKSPEAGPPSAPRIAEAEASFQAFRDFHGLPDNASVRAGFPWRQFGIKAPLLPPAAVVPEPPMAPIVAMEPPSTLAAATPIIAPASAKAVTLAASDRASDILEDVISRTGGAGVKAAEAVMPPSAVNIAPIMEPPPTPAAMATLPEAGIAPVRPTVAPETPLVVPSMPEPIPVAQAVLEPPVAPKAGPKPRVPLEKAPDPYKILTADERSEIANFYDRLAYPPEIAEKMIEASDEYHQLADAILRGGKPVKGTPEAEALQKLRDRKGVLGIRMKALADEAEDEGLITPAARREVSNQINEAFKEAAAQRFPELETGTTIPAAGAPSAIGKVAPAALADAIEGPLPPVGSKVTEQLPRGGDIERTIEATKLEGLGLPRALDDRLTTFQKGVADGTISPEEASRLEAELQQELIKSVAKTDTGIDIGGGFGALGQVFKTHPEFAIKAALIAGGALTGAVTDPFDDPVLSAILMGGAAVGAGKAIGLLKSLKVNPAQHPEIQAALKSPEGRSSLLKDIYLLLPHVQRANLLMHHHGIPANVFVGPWGAGFFGTLEKTWGGDPRGSEALHDMLRGGNWLREWKESIPEARELIKRAAAGDPELRAELHGDVVERWVQRARGVVGPRGEQITRGYLQSVGLWMTAGDIATRRILMRAGYSLQEAKKMTFTSEPVDKWIRGLVNLKREAQKSPIGPIADMMAPFIRTPANLFEQGLRRLPGLGLLYQGALVKRGDVPIPIREQAVQQGLSLALGTTGYFMGLVIPEDNMSAARRYLANLAGPYSMIMGIGLALGQGQQKTGKWLSPELTKTLEYSMPLPVFDTPTSYLSSFMRVVHGEEPTLPRGVIPAMFQDLSKEPSIGLPKLPSRRTIVIQP